MQTSKLHITRLKEVQKNDATDTLEKVALGDTYSPVWQTFWWTNFLKKTGYIDAGFCIHSDDGETVCFVQKRSIGLRQYGLFVLGGPIVGQDQQNQKALGDALKELCKKERCLFIQVEPLHPDLQLGNSDFKLGTSYKRFIEPTTALIDLTKTQEEMLAQMKPKGRYNIKQAQKHEVRIVLDNSEEAVQKFYDLLCQTTKRNHFSGNHKQYYIELCKVLEDLKIGGLYLAHKDDDLIAGSIFVFYGNLATYYYGASTSDNTKRKYMASYLLQWHAIMEAQKRGCGWFDFLGIAQPDDSTSHLAGVTDFKLKFGPLIHTWPQATTYAPSKLKYSIFTWIRKRKHDSR